MAHPSPLLTQHAKGSGLLGRYGPPNQAVELVEAFDPVEIEYASIRRHAGVFDAAHRATLEVSGPDRVEFLNRMLTNDLKPAAGFDVFTTRRAFLLNRKGRVDADLRLINLPDRILIDLDAFAAQRTRDELDRYLITENATIRDASHEWSVLSLHGPAAALLLSRLSSPIDGASLLDIHAKQVARARMVGVDTVIDREDLTGEIGLEVRVPTTGLEQVYEAISTPWSARESGDAVAPTTDLARRIGWHALNIARIEVGQGLFLIDFGTDSLPHECGDAILADRVSFKKGCYLGQEIVARMQSLGHPKQKLVGLRVTGASLDGVQAVTGTPIVEADAPGAPVVGAVTSSCLSPLLSQAGIALAMVKFCHSRPGTPLWLQLDGCRLAATTQPPGGFIKLR